MLDKGLKEELGRYLELLENQVVFKRALSKKDQEKSDDLREFTDQVAALSPKISIEDVEDERVSFALESSEGVSGVKFAGVPLGHEFESFVLALLQVGGRAPKISDEARERIEAIDQDLDFTTYVSLSCHNCPDVVQALNIMSVLNPRITNTMVDGESNRQEVEDKNIMAVPTVYLNGEEFGGGRMTLDDILSKLGVEDSRDFDSVAPYDLLVLGGGPAGGAAAIYAARKGIRVGLVAKDFGGQVMETLAIENVIGTKSIIGEDLMANVRDHINDYEVDIIEDIEFVGVEKKEDLFHVKLENGQALRAKTLVVATGAQWKQIGVPGEEELKGKGVAYCPHCDGPLFKGKDVAVIGGGNSGIEAAIDLAGIVENVTVLEFLDELKADQVLQDRVKDLDNVKVITSAATSKIMGDEKVTGVEYTDRNTDQTHQIDLDGVFVQIGLLPRTEVFKDLLELNQAGEIVIDKFGATSVEGIFAGGDCAESAYKQIIISMGSGATAALGAFDYLIRNA